MCHGSIWFNWQLDNLSSFKETGIGQINFPSSLTFFEISFKIHLQRPRSSFHQLLMTLAVVDCILITFYIVDSSVAVWTHSESYPFWYRVSFPYFWHPGKAITLSSSIFMVVAISAERYVVWYVIMMVFFIHSSDC